MAERLVDASRFASVDTSHHFLFTIKREKDITIYMHIKYILASVVIIGLVIWGGVALFSEKPVIDDSQMGRGVVTDPYATSTDIQTSNNAAVPANTSTSTNQSTNTNTKRTNHMITIETNYGTIQIETYDSDAPNTVANFVTLASKGFYNNLIFHRVIPGFMIQGGDPKGNGTGGPGYQFADELNPDTASYKAGYKKGVVAMANAGPNTNGSQFFIMAADYPLPNSYTIFGHVVTGQDVVDAIDHVQTGAGDKPVTPVVMKSVIVK